MKFNIRTDCDEDKRYRKRSFTSRAPVIEGAVRGFRPDIICWQETLPHVKEWISETFADMYITVGDGREADGGGESNPISYRKDRFTVREYDMFWLSPTPRTPGSKYKGAGCPRVCTALTLTETASGSRLRVYNTHLDNVSARARYYAVRSILARITRDIKASDIAIPIILAGDFNVWQNEAAIRSVCEYDLYPFCDAIAGSFVTFHDFGRCEGGKIDYIFTGADAEISDVNVWKTVTPDGVFISDHWPVSVTLDL